MKLFFNDSSSRGTSFETSLIKGSIQLSAIEINEYIYLKDLVFEKQFQIHGLNAVNNRMWITDTDFKGGVKLIVIYLLRLSFYKDELSPFISSCFYVTILRNLTVWRIVNYGHF